MSRVRGHKKNLYALPFVIRCLFVSIMAHKSKPYTILDLLDNKEALPVSVRYPLVHARCKTTRDDPSESESGEQKFDIFSGLIDMDLANIVENIFSNLSETDVANAVAANPTWATIVSSRRHAEQYFSRDGDNALLKTLYRRRELLSGNVYRNASAIFKQACIDYSRLGKCLVRHDSSWVEFKVEYPFKWCIEGSNMLSDVFVGNEYIAPVHFVGLGYIIQLYDRWTFQFVNAICIQDRGRPKLDLMSNLVLIQCHTWEWSSAMVWNQATGTVHTLFSSSQFRAEIFSVASLIVLLKQDGKHCIASVYKCNSGTQELIVDDEPLHLLYEKIQNNFKIVHSDESQEFFGLLGKAITERTGTGGYVFQLRSKHDFSLRKVIIDNSHWNLLRYTFCFLSDCFVFALDEIRMLYVLSFVDGEVTLVYIFNQPQEMRHLFDRERIISKVGNFLVFHDGRSVTQIFSRYGVAIWKLPSNFIDVCFRHLKERTSGITKAYDQLVGTCDGTRFRESDRIYVKVDQYGVMKIRLDDRLSVMHVTMINNMILNGED